MDPISVFTADPQGSGAIQNQIIRCIYRMAGSIFIAAAGRDLIGSSGGSSQDRLVCLHYLDCRARSAGDRSVIEDHMDAALRSTVDHDMSLIQRSGKDIRARGGDGNLAAADRYSGSFCGCRGSIQCNLHGSAFVISFLRIFLFQVFCNCGSRSFCRGRRCSFCACIAAG